MRKLNWQEICEIRLDEARGLTRKELCDKFSLSYNYLSQILRYEVWTEPPTEPEVGITYCRYCKNEAAWRGMCSDCHDKRIARKEERVNLQAQKRCEICGKAASIMSQTFLCADHDHGTGEFRGALCHGCNSVLGKVGDNPRILQKMIDYLQERGRTISKSLLS